MIANTGDGEPKKEDRTTTAPVLPPILMSRSFADLDLKIEKDIKTFAKSREGQDFWQNELYERFEADTVANDLRGKAQEVIDKLE